MKAGHRVEIGSSATAFDGDQGLLSALGADQGNGLAALPEGLRRRSIVSIVTMALAAAFESAEPRRIGRTSATAMVGFTATTAMFRSATDEQTTREALRQNIAE